MQSFLSFLLLCLLAGQFFSSLFALISSTVFWQDTLLNPILSYIIKKERITIIFIGQDPKFIISHREVQKRRKGQCCLSPLLLVFSTAVMMAGLMAGVLGIFCPDFSCKSVPCIGVAAA
jgi:hypothetical protein